MENIKLDVSTTVNHSVWYAFLNSVGTSVEDDIWFSIREPVSYSTTRTIEPMRSIIIK